MTESAAAAAAVVVVGCVLGTKDATPLEFWLAVAPGAVLKLDDVVMVETERPDGAGAVRFYGVVDHVRTLMEGASFDTDTFLATEGQLPHNVSYVAHVAVTRLEPEEYLPPKPGDAAYLATGAMMDIALHFDGMKRRVPAGLLRNGEPAYFNLEFLNGEKGAHVNISGVSGVATKTSYALFLLHALLNSEALGAARANTKALLFNVKGEDLFFLDKPNGRRAAHEGPGKPRYEALGLSPTPFGHVSFRAAPRRGTPHLVKHLDQRDEAVGPYCWSLREVCAGRLIRFLFADENLALSNLGTLVSAVEERLAKIAQENDQADARANRLRRAHLEIETEEGGLAVIEGFGELVKFIDERFEGADPGWTRRQTEATQGALIRRLWGMVPEVSHLIRGDLAPDEIDRYRLDPLDPATQLSVCDINKLSPRAQKFVVGVLLSRLFAEKERQGRNPVVFIVLDELNKYAPREGSSPIKDLLVEIAERGRSLGIILIGAQQTASEVERRVVGQCAIRVVGRLDSAEAERPEYNFLPAAAKKRVLFLKSGKLFVTQPEVPAPLLVEFPFPAYATRPDEVQALAEVDEEAVFDRF